jgi:hypothetical protein
MKKALMLMVLGLFVVSMMGAVSAETFIYEDKGVICEVDDDVFCESYTPTSKSFSASSAKSHPIYTVVAGRIWNEDATAGVRGANVEIICDNNESLTTKNTTSLAEGFFIEFFDDIDCSIGDLVTINADDGNGLVGHEGPREIKKKLFFDWNIIYFRVPMTPEFGFILGLLTLVSAVGIFFVVRRD